MLKAGPSRQEALPQALDQQTLDALKHLLYTRHRRGHVHINDQLAELADQQANR